MLPECCNLRPVVLGEEPELCSEGRLQVGRLLCSKQEERVSKGRRALPSQQTAKPQQKDGFGKSKALGVAHRSPPGRMRRWQIINLE